MIMEATARHNILNSIIYKRKKWLPLSVLDRRKSLYQAVSAHLPTGNSAGTAYLHCIKDGTNIDPTCGSGGMLIQSKQYVEEQGQDANNLAVFGQDNASSVWSICKMNMIMHGITNAQIAYEDTLMKPAFEKGSGIEQFDRVIANPPFSQNYKKSDKMQHQERFVYGWAPETGKKADLMFVQHMIASLNDKGMMVTVMPHGVLFRGGKEKDIRKAILTDPNDIVQAIISLPPDLFYGTGIPTGLSIVKKMDTKNIVSFFVCSSYSV